MGYFVFRIRRLGENLNQSFMNNNLGADGAERECHLDVSDCLCV